MVLRLFGGALVLEGTSSYRYSVCVCPNEQGTLGNVSSWHADMELICVLVERSVPKGTQANLMIAQ